MLSPEITQRLLAEGVSQDAINILSGEEYETENDLQQAGFTSGGLRAMDIKGKSAGILLRLYGQPQQLSTTPATSALPASITLEMPGTTRCGNCTNVLEENVEFCPRCGTPVASKLVCIKCDKQGGAGEMFCSRDGGELVPALDALCLRALMSEENMSVAEARNALKTMDHVRRGKLQDRAMQRGGGSYGSQIFRDTQDAIDFFRK